MAPKVLVMSLVTILVIVLCTGVTAQSSCINVITRMSPCLNYITGNSSKPSSSCCSQFSNVVESQPECLCQVLNGSGSQSALGIKPTRALQLPNACRVQTPPISQCQADSPPGSSDTPSSSGQGKGQKTAPSTDVDSSNGNSTKLPSFILIFILTAVLYARF